MKTTEQVARHRVSLQHASQCDMPFAPLIRHLLAMAMLVCAVSAPAAQFIWDPSGNGSGNGGSGNWDTTAGNKVWYNGSSDVAWTQTGTNTATTGATFGGGDGTYAINVDSTQVAVTNLTINNSGYTFSGNDIYMATGDSLLVAANKTVNFACNLTSVANNSIWWTLDSGATMNITGNITDTAGVTTSGQEIRLGGYSGSSYNLSGNNAVAYLYCLGPVNITGGSTIVTSELYIAYNNQAFPQPNVNTFSSGSLTIANATVTDNGNVIIVGRAGGTGTLTINNGSTVNFGTAGSAAHPLALCYDGTAGESATFNMNGGTLTVGSSTYDATTSAIDFFDTAAAVSPETAVMSQTGGTVNAWGGINIAPAGGAAGTSATLTQTGGALNVGPNGIIEGAYSGTVSITLSGGTVGDLTTPGWSSTLPITLGTTGGNISFNPANTINLSGALTGPGGLNVTSGTLALTGANNYGGSTGVSGSGTLAVSTSASPISGGAVTVDGTSGTPTLTVNSAPGNSWSIGGGLTFQNNNTQLSYQFSTLPPSTSVAPIQVTGNVAFTATPAVIIGGSEISDGVYPLITYTGNLTGTLPTSVTTWQGGSASAGTIYNSGKTIYLQVTSSTVSAGIYWQAAGGGAWNTGTANWTQFNAPADYADGDTVIFDNSATGAGPFAISLNTTVNPNSVTFNNSTKSYAISGSGNINGAATLAVDGSGTVTLATPNTYTGGTILSSGQLNINNAGSGSTSAIGTGTLTINPNTTPTGPTIDNTSGSDITLQPGISENWDGNFTYAGSANNFNTGSGGVALNGNMAINVNAMNFTVPGQISDGGNGYQLTKNGNGTLTLLNFNFIGGAFTLAGGQVNLGNGGATGEGSFIIDNNTTIDNTSGGPLTLGAASYTWGGSFTFLGSADLNLGPANVTIPNGLGNITVNVVSNTLTTDGSIVNNNTEVIKSGNGTWAITGGTSSESLGLEVSAGEVTLDCIGFQAIAGGNYVGLTVLANGLVQDETNNQIHSDTKNTPLPVSLSGGVFDLNGFNENLDILNISDGGTLAMSASGTNSTVNLISGYTASLSGTNCQFNVAASGVLNFDGPIGGSGSLVTIGPGTLNLASNNIYTGNTIISNGTLALIGNGSINSSAMISVGAGGTLDVTGVDPYTLSSSTALSASGTGAAQGTTAATINDSASGGTVNLGSQPISLTFTPTGFTGDTGHPALYISQGALTLNGNVFTVNNNGGAPLGTGTYQLIQVAGGTINSSGSYSVSVTGSGLAAGVSGSIQVSNGNVNLVIAPAPTPAMFVGPFPVSGSTLTLKGTGGTANGTYHVYSSTNVSTPLASWTLVGSGSFDGSGDFSFPVTINPNDAAQFFILAEP